MAKTLTKPQKATLIKLDASLDSAMDGVYQAAHPRRDVVFTECYKMASKEAKDAYDRANSARTSFRNAMVDAGRAYWSQPFGMFMPY
jgi:hypothetical protein